MWIIHVLIKCQRTRLSERSIWRHHLFRANTSWLWNWTQKQLQMPHLFVHLGRYTGMRSLAGHLPKRVMHTSQHTQETKSSVWDLWRFNAAMMPQNGHQPRITLLMCQDWLFLAYQPVKLWTWYPLPASRWSLTTSDHQHQWKNSRNSTHLLKPYAEPHTLIAKENATLPHWPPTQDSRRNQEQEVWGVIRHVWEHTDWCSSLVHSMKHNGSFGVFLYPKSLNEAFKRCPTRFQLFWEVNPTFEGAKFFSKLDAKAGYWSVPREVGDNLWTATQ